MVDEAKSLAAVASTSVKPQEPVAGNPAQSAASLADKPPAESTASVTGEKAKGEGKTEKEEVKKKGEDEEGFFGGKRDFGGNLIRSFRPYRYLLIAFGRWPLTHHANPDGTYTYKLRWHHPRGIYFVAICIYYLYVLIAGGFSLASILLFLTGEGSTDLVRENGTDVFVTKNSTRNASRREVSLFREGLLVQRHLGLMVSLWTNVFLTVITSLNVLWKHKYMINYFSFWTRAVQTMHMDVSKGTSTHSYVTVGLYAGCVLILTLLSLGRIGATSIGGPVLMSIFTLRFFNGDMLTYTSLDTNYSGGPGTLVIYMILGGIGHLFVFVGSKAYLLLYLFKTKLLRNAFASWNGRVYAAILRGGDFTQTKEGRTTYNLLFKDHCVLLDLLEGTNRFFSGVLESYFLLQVSALCFELYVVIRTSKNGQNQEQAAIQGFFVREFDFIPSILIFVLNSTLIYSVAKSAALVGEEAIAGLEVIRRKTMLGRKTDEELYFMLSMYTSYISYRRIELSAGGYFYINKEFVVTLVSTIFSYFIILYQFQPLLDPIALPGSPNDTLPFAKRETIGRFFVALEGGRDCNWLLNNSITSC